VFAGRTEQAVCDFQTQRGLHVDGRCDQHTWASLVEASWELGARILLLTSPNMRGDDVAELQSRLARLGFDCGRVDGILGPLTDAAIRHFQADCGLLADGICGAATTKAIRRVGSQSGDGPGVAMLREREQLRRMGTLADCRVVVGQFGGLSGLTRTLARHLRRCGAAVICLDEPDPVAQAVAANNFAADVFIGFEAHPDPRCVIHFYQVATFESAGGRALAEALAAAFTEPMTRVGGTQPTVSGKRLPVLRETRMPAVLCLVGPPRAATDDAHELADAGLVAVKCWLSATR